MSALDQIASLLGSENILASDTDMQPYLIDWRTVYQGKAQAVITPRSTEQVSQLLSWAQAHDQVIVPQGGNTGLVGGGIPDKSGASLLLSLRKMNKIRDLSKENRSMVAEAGCVLEDLHKAAEAEDLYFPLNLAARGSCSIGGNLSTNAGGLNVLRYGNARDLCLGLEVVLADGQVMNLLSPLRKDNTGYDLKNLFIGAEGTLGIITAASLKLFSLPKARATALAGVRSVADGVTLLSRLQAKSGDQVEAFEILPAVLLDAVLEHFPQTQKPLAQTHPFILLMEIASSDASLAEAGADGATPMNRLMEAFLAEAFEDELITDATLAANETQRQRLWDIREVAPEVSNKVQNPVNSDISVRVADLDSFYQDASARVRAICETTRICGFGHMGDGNLHFNLYEKAGGDPAWEQKRPALVEAVYESLQKFNGSISAEHGIGVSKAARLAATKDPVALHLMQQIKQLLDPKNLLNPGKILK